ncbi:MAG: hypothetical protein V1494_05095 [Candidatus Diapherotrites archaeon]
MGALEKPLDTTVALALIIIPFIYSFDILWREHYFDIIFAMIAFGFGIVYLYVHTPTKGTKFDLNVKEVRMGK